MFNETQLILIQNTALQVRNQLENKYGSSNEDMMGKCIEASDLITEKLKHLGFKAESYRVWCLYEYFQSCTNYCYEEHWITKVVSGQEKLYIDVTMNQFQWAFISKRLPRIYLDDKLPNFYLTRKPGKTTLDKCGWTSWYNTGDYINKFNYWD